MTKTEEIKNMGSENKHMTGYPSIDKPWLQYYSEGAINDKLPNCNIRTAELLKHCE